MIHFVIALFTFITSSLGQVGFQRLICNYKYHEGLYSCEIELIEAFNQNEPLYFLGDHLEGHNRNDVKKIYYSYNFSPQALWILHKDIVPYFINLQILHLQDLDLQILRNDSFSSCDNLITINLQLNSIYEIPNGIFRNCSKLKNLDLSWNSIKKISSETFIGLSNLNNLTLNGNQFTLNGEEFHALTELKELRIINSTINSVNLLQNLQNLEIIDLSRTKRNFVKLQEVLNEKKKLKEIRLNDALLSLDDVS